MAKKRGRKLTKIVLEVGEDSSLWCHADLDAALRANIDGLARLIRIGEDKRRDAAAAAEQANSRVDGAA